MSLKHGLLGLLTYSDMSGYELSKAFSDSLSFFWQAQSSQIYRELNKLEEEGCLSSHIEIQTDKPNKRIYSITEAGKAEFRSWLNGPSPKIPPTRSESLMRLFFSAEKSTEEIAAELKNTIELYQRQLNDFYNIENIINQYKMFSHNERDLLFWDLTAEYGRAYSKMKIEWAENCLQRLKEMEESK